ncbi:MULTISPECIES: lipase family protein [Mycolicibacterium]|uniref:Secretory lipase n=1 Tax=Mycolicibacterium rhodesiae (strain NBB3) TaxID=710685 RepID=G8RKC6_MYCRN|nr:MULTISPECIES: lipase family protein [Mycolicibacterium]AEV73528.1 Secretory lipase [Mycolicibacterium rhodesiae NBB3]
MSKGAHSQRCRMQILGSTPWRGQSRSRTGTTAYKRVLTGLLVVVCAIAATGLTAGVAPPARADETKYLEFYTPPDPLPPGKPGDLIRSEPARLVYEPSGQLGSWVATGTRIMYRTTNAKGEPVAATGVYLEPHNPWPGKGPRPLIAYAPGPYGLGDQCAPSRLMDQGIHFSQGFDLTFNYEETFLATMVARGFAIIVADGVGMGIHNPGGPGPEFANRLSAGTGLLDAARAAMQLPGTSLDPHGPVAFWGWLTGGQAAGSAVEQAATYAPEVNIVGAALNTPVANLSLMPPFLDGNLLVGALAYVLNGVVNAYPETKDLLIGTLAPRGLHFVQWSSEICLVQSVADFAFRHLYFPDNTGYFNVDPATLFGNDPVKSLLLAQNLGQAKPTGPVYISTNRYDTFNPYQASVDLKNDWCAKGADVQLWTNQEPPFLNKASINTLLPYFIDGERSMQWLADRFNGLPTTPNCAEAPAPQPA